MKKLAAALVCAVPLLISSGADAQIRPDRAIRLRQSAMLLMNHNLVSIGNMVNGKKPYNKDESIRNATRIEALSSQPWEFFVPGSEKGETKARPELWKERDQFKAAAEKFQVEAAKLSQVAKTGDVAALKTQFGATADACDACHDNYREP